MRDRFMGGAGAPLLIAALLEQRLVQNNSVIAEALAAKGEVVEFAEDDTIIGQGGSDNSPALHIERRSKGLRE